MSFKKLSIKEIIDFILNGNITLAFHPDADGVCSAVLIALTTEIKDIVSPFEFGNYVLDETTKTFVDLGLDLGAPIDKEFNKIIIDHHEHPNDIHYNLIHDNVPTSLIVYKLFKERIPENKKWLVVVGLSGDGSLDLVPDEIWDNNTFLFDRRTSIYRSKYGKLSEYSFPIYKLLSAPVNAMCRIGSPLEAFNILFRVKTPYDILRNKAMISDNEILNSDENEIWSKEGIKAIEINRDIAVVEIESNYRQAGRIAAKLRSMNNNITWIVVNKKNKHISIRGELAKYVANKLKQNNITAGGHASYCAGTLDDLKVDDLITILKKEVTW